MTFKFLQAQIFMGTIYLKKPERVETLSYVFLIIDFLYTGEKGQKNYGKSRRTFDHPGQS